MSRSPFLWKLYAGFSLIILIATAIVGTLIGQRMETDTYQEVERNLKARASFLSNLLSQDEIQNFSAAFQTRIKKLGTQTSTRITIIRKDGVVVADSDESPDKMDNHKDRPEVMEASSKGVGMATRFSDTVGTKMLYLVQPIDDWGYVRTSVPLSVIDERLAHLHGVVLIGALVATLSALILGFLLARHFVTPIVMMTSLAENMAEGDYSQQIPTKRQDEIGVLAAAFNRMSKNLRDRMETITTDRNKLSVILSGMVEALVAVDCDEKVVHLNAAAGRLLGASPEKSLNKPIWEITRTREISAILRDTLKDGNELHEVLRIVTPTREQLLEMHTSPLHDARGNFVGAVALLHDITEIDRLEAVRRDFVANASHELKTPITAIRGLVETILEDTELSAEQRQRFLTKIRNQSMRLSTIVTDLLALSRLESGGQADFGPVEIVSVIDVTTRALAHTAEARNIVIHRELSTQEYLVSGDEKALGQMITNVLDNAIKYTPENGEIWIRLQESDGKIQIEVEDTGIGIDAIDCERIFERFYRVDKARSRELGGTGLGLSIVKHVALRHGGQVSLQSAPGMGSTFSISLPLAPSSNDDDPSRSSSANLD